MREEALAITSVHVAVRLSHTYISPGSPSCLVSVRICVHNFYVVLFTKKETRVPNNSLHWKERKRRAQSSWSSGKAAHKPGARGDLRAATAFSNTSRTQVIATHTLTHTTENNR